MPARFDTAALCRALDEQRLQRGLTWQQVAREIGVSASTITRTRRGGRLEVDDMLAMVGWLSVPVETFVRQSPPSMS
jgi:transcriptional regulator with XRE-family HTH domain